MCSDKTGHVQGGMAVEYKDIQMSCSPGDANDKSGRVKNKVSCQRGEKLLIIFKQSVVTIFLTEQCRLEILLHTKQSSKGNAFICMTICPEIEKLCRKRGGYCILQK